ncbi:hypothetical protein, partial [Thiolapillus sp.]|uniref:hypothetical protein n=1 Tax=Thiolapillus sp. TaxID=2017437 RepID=UPI003AF78018
MAAEVGEKVYRSVHGCLGAQQYGLVASIAKKTFVPKKAPYSEQMTQVSGKFTQEKAGQLPGSS